MRSGVLTSVHAFAADPERGLFILIFLALVVGGSLLLYALRAPSVASRVSYTGVSRESLLMVNNLVFTVATIVVLLGTLFPLVMDAFLSRQIFGWAALFQRRIRAVDGARDAVYDGRAALALARGLGEALAA